MGRSESRQAGGPTRSVDPCPVCGEHALALERPPHIAVTGPQPYTELYQMGDLLMPVGVRCRSCGTAWPSMESLAAGEPGSAEEVEAVDGLDGPDAGPSEVARAPSPVGLGIATIVVLGAGLTLAVAGLLEPAFIAVGAIVLAARYLTRRRRDG